LFSGLVRFSGDGSACASRLALRLFFYPGWLCRNAMPETPKDSVHNRGAAQPCHLLDDGLDLVFSVGVGHLVHHELAERTPAPPLLLDVIVRIGLLGA
jgi:hypothetical protein